MAVLNDLTNKTIGNWLVLHRNGSTPNKAAIWKCKCLLCGSEYNIRGYTLTSGKSTKCRSCVPKVTLSKPHRKDSIYNVYNGMMQRCTNPNHKYFACYGGRGISVCDEWYKNPDAFIEWAYSNGYHDGLSIERIDIDKGYSPINCCWIPLAEQAKNRRMVIFVNYEGARYCLADACRIAKISYDTVRSYHHRHNDMSWQECFDHYIG